MFYDANPIVEGHARETSLTEHVGSDDIVLLQDVLDEVVNGRTEGHKCPFCTKGSLDVTLDEGTLRLECSSCRKYFEGRF